jgi:hypothetical protein
LQEMMITNTFHLNTITKKAYWSSYILAYNAHSV